MTVGQCPQLEVLVFQECSIVPDWRSHSLGNHIKVISCSVDHLQMFGLQILPSQVLPNTVFQTLCSLKIVEIEQTTTLLLNKFEI